MKRRYYCGMCDAWFSRGGDCKRCGFQLESALVDEPEQKRSVCACGGGWTFDFAAKRVYCRTCEAKKEQTA